MSESPIVGAVELGGTKIVMAYGTGPGDIRDRTVVPTTTAEETLRRVIAFFKQHSGLRAIGIGCFGPVCIDRHDRDWGSILVTTKPGWSGVSIASRIADALGLPVALDTDVNAAAIGEFGWGGLKDCAVGLYITVGTGIGGGAMIRGQPLHGLRHPEMGHVSVRRADRSFSGVCPVHGDCMEGLASGPAIMTRLGCTLSEADPGDPEVAAIYRELGNGLANIALTLSPERIVLGGGVAKAPGFHARVHSALGATLGSYAPCPEVVAPGLGDNAGIAGAIALAHGVVAGSAF